MLYKNALEKLENIRRKVDYNKLACTQKLEKHWNLGMSNVNIIKNGLKQNLLFHSFKVISSRFYSSAHTENLNCKYDLRILSNVIQISLAQTTRVRLQ